MDFGFNFENPPNEFNVIHQVSLLNTLGRQCCFYHVIFLSQKQMVEEMFR